MKTTKLFCTVLFLSTLNNVACGSGSNPGDDTIEPTPPDVSGGGSGSASAPDASVPANCDPSSLPAKDACVVNETLGVFVAPPSADGGASSNEDGTRGHPFSKMQNAIDAAKVQKKRVYACIGSYAEQITLADGVSIFGDLDCNQNWSVVAKHATLKSPASPAVRADQIATATRVDSLDMIAPDGTTAGESSIAMIANASPALTVANATIHAGNGMKGADGVEGAQLANGPSLNGSSNSQALLEDCNGFSSNPVGCAPRHATAVAGGVNQCTGSSRNISGGSGGSGGIGLGNAIVSGTATFVQFAGQYYQIPGIQASNGNPQPGNALTAAGGLRGNTKVAWGASGGSGAHGASGSSAGAGGVISLTGFATADGTAGTDGAPGQGGGGGSGYDYVAQSTTSFAAGDNIYFTNGPGGGAGGCPALAGTAGQGGGASIAIIAADSPMNLTACTIQASNGGDGGKGTFGSEPTLGGAWGYDNDPGVCATTACDFGSGTNLSHHGGNGGTGGISGLSGSGAGGPSIGIAYHGGIVVTDVPSTTGIAGHGVPAFTSGVKEGGAKTVPTSVDGTVALTVTF